MILKLLSLLVLVLILIPVFKVAKKKWKQVDLDEKMEEIEQEEGMVIKSSSVAPEVVKENKERIKNILNS